MVINTLIARIDIFSKIFLRLTSSTLPRGFPKFIYNRAPYNGGGGVLRWLKKSSKEMLSREGIYMRFGDASL